MELWNDGENRDSSEGRQTKGIERVEDGVESRQARKNEKIDGVEGHQARCARRWRTGVKGVSQGGSRQSRLAWKGDGGGSEEANGVGMCSPMNNPQPRLDPQHRRMAQWPKTPGELEGYIGAESMRTIRRERESCVCVVYSRCIYRVSR